MSERDLANLNENAVSIIAEYGKKKYKDFVLKEIIPEELAKAHRECSYWIHDLEYYNITYNCVGISFEKINQNKNICFDEALEGLFEMVVEITNEQSGGLGIINFDSDMSCYIKEESDKEIALSIRRFLNNLNLNLKKGYEKAYTTLNIGLDTTKNGRRLVKILLEEYRKGNYHKMPYIFPNIVFKLKKGVNKNEEDINFDLYLEALKTTAVNMNPTYMNCDSTINRDLDADKLGIVGCRSRIAANLYGDTGAVQRGNIACITINLVQLSLKSNGDFLQYKKNLDEIMEKAKELLINRIFELSKKMNLNFLKKYNLYLEKNDESIFDILKKGTLAIGFIGLWEAVEYMTQSQDIEKNYKIGYEIIEYMKKKIDIFIEKEKLNFSLIGSAAENVSGRFPETDKQKFGNISGITDKEYYTNSFHIPVDKKIRSFVKIKREGEFHKLCTGGSITYVELNDIPQNNIEAVKELVDMAYESNCNYFGINFPLDICNCGYKGIMGEKCPQCGSKEILRLRRVSGYLADIRNFSSGKRAELKNRIAYYEKIKKNLL